jgi:hypothetical protein
LYLVRTAQLADWTVIRPGRLINGDVGRPYLKAPETPGGRVTTRTDLAKVIAR